ncbi:hypothetical protein MKEN_00349100 [Mycena kentingensis (nom. inval.)]|nr:hypothetical protein MKEN_00349100 [Mycena kentingensis (nom. inval.)]
MSTTSNEEEPLLLRSPDDDEHHPLFPRPTIGESRRWRPHPYWVIPIVFVVNLARGMTLSPRINVYTDIACRALDSADPSSLLGMLAQDCKAPAVAARASKIQASLLTIMSVLSSASTGLWSQYGDVRGRRVVFYVSIAGFVAMELVFLLVSVGIPSIESRGESFILIGPVLEGFAGGLSVFNGVVHAYVSDCSADGSRSRIFSVIQGIQFVGMATGPWIAGILQTYTSLGVYSMFSVSIGVQLVLLLYITFLFPESLRKKEPSHTSLEPVSPSLPADPRHVLQRMKQFGVAFISPLTIFRPRRVERGATSRIDYNVTFMGVAMFLYITSTAVYQLKYLYGKQTYSWDPKQVRIRLGPKPTLTMTVSWCVLFLPAFSKYLYFSGLLYVLGMFNSCRSVPAYHPQLWFCRAINLFFVLPLIVQYFKPKTPITGASTPEEIASELNFDKRLAQGSLVVDGLSDLLITITSSQFELGFIVLSCVAAFTSGGNPALHSLGAVCLHALGYGNETGRLFGAIGVLSAASHSVSPALYAWVFSSTVETHPKTIFGVASALLFSSVTLLGLIRSKGW